MISRRRLIAGAAALFAAPAIIRTPGLLMPVKPIPDALPTYTNGYRLDLLIERIDELGALRQERIPVPSREGRALGIYSFDIPDLGAGVVGARLVIA